MRLTDEQGAVQDAAGALKAGDNLKVIAFAGAGKTTTLKACAQARNDRGCYLAFNKSIAAEAKEKLGTTKCQAMTMHGLAYRAMMDIMGKPSDVTTNTIKNSNILSEFHVPPQAGWGEYRIASAVARTIAKFCASADSDFKTEHAVEALIESLGDPDFMLQLDKAEKVRNEIDRLAAPICMVAQNFFLRCMKDGVYNHDMYLKMLDIDESVRADAFRSFKYLMVDEAQDINPVQRSILTKTGLPLIAVGDPFQQIYSWRGAENALKLLPGKELFLTQSFRFGDDIAKIARKILSSIPDDGGPKHRLEGAGPGPKSDKPKGAVICRTNIGMLDEAIKYLNKGHSVHVDNIDGLLRDALSAQALKDGRMGDIKSPELKQFDSWEEMEIIADEGGDPMISKLVNLIQTNRIPDVQRLAKSQNPDAKNAPLSIFTAHRSKGLEFDAVQLAEDWPEMSALDARYKSSKDKSAKHMTLALESYNTLYVAATRAKLRCKGYSRIFDGEVQKVGIMTQEEQAAAYAPAAGDARREVGQMRREEADYNDVNF